MVATVKLLAAMAVAPLWLLVIFLVFWWQLGVLAGLLALMIAIGTIAGHAFRVARANPILALRYE